MLATSARGAWAPASEGMPSMPVTLRLRGVPAAILPGVAQPCALPPTRVSQMRAGLGRAVNCDPVAPNQPSMSTATLTVPTLFQSLTVQAEPLQPLGTGTMTRLATASPGLRLTLETMGWEARLPG